MASTTELRSTTGWWRRKATNLSFLSSFAHGGGAVFVSSHQLGEMSLLADEVIVINRGTLVAQTSVLELTKGAVGSTRVRTPDLERLRALVNDQGLEGLDPGGDRRCRPRGDLSDHERAGRGRVRASPRPAVLPARLDQRLAVCGRRRYPWVHR